MREVERKKNLYIIDIMDKLDCLRKINFCLLSEFAFDICGGSL